MNLALKNRLAATERSTWYTLASIGLILVIVFFQVRSQRHMVRVASQARAEIGRAHV